MKLRPKFSLMLGLITLFETTLTSDCLYGRVRCNTLWSCKWLPTFGWYLSPPSSGIQSPEDHSQHIRLENLRSQLSVGMPVDTYYSLLLTTVTLGPLIRFLSFVVRGCLFFFSVTRAKNQIVFT